MNFPIRLALAIVLLASPVVQAHEPVMTIPDPGFRPESVIESQFLGDIDTATIAVYPTIVRRIERTAQSFTSQAQVVESLKERGIGQVITAHRRIDPGRLDPQSQWLIFESGLRTMAEVLADSQLEADYSLMLEVLVPGDDAVFGIECYIVDREGQNAFSFLLNEHFRMFTEAGLVASGSQAERDAMIVKATTVAMQALKEQIARAQHCASLDSDQPPIRLPSDFIDDFETKLVSGPGADDIPLGFSIFRGERSRARISTTTVHPPVPGETPGNSVLKLDLDVKTWAGVLHRFENESVDHWIAHDFSDAQELSFWLHGNNSGTTLVIDVLDNRRACPSMDDAERYSYQFIDDVSGWQLISIPFEVMARKEIGNGAPNDGLGLSAVHGWAFAALNTEGEVTYFIDDVRVRRVPLLDSVPEGLSRERDIWVPINELPMFGGYEKTASQLKADEEFLRMFLPKFNDDRQAAAEHFAQIGWNLYYRDDRPGAIKRFNQAWLLHPESQHALWGFAVISRERGKTDAALRFYRMALEAGPAQPALKEEYESLRRQAAD